MKVCKMQQHGFMQSITYNSGTKKTQYIRPTKKANAVQRQLQQTIPVTIVFNLKLRAIGAIPFIF